MHVNVCILSGTNNVQPVFNFSLCTPQHPYGGMFRYIKNACLQVMKFCKGSNAPNEDYKPTGTEGKRMRVFKSVSLQSWFRTPDPLQNFMT